MRPGAFGQICGQFEDHPLVVVCGYRHIIERQTIERGRCIVVLRKTDPEIRPEASAQGRNRSIERDAKSFPSRPHSGQRLDAPSSHATAAAVRTGFAPTRQEKLIHVAKGSGFGRQCRRWRRSGRRALRHRRFRRAGRGELLQVIQTIQVDVGGFQRIAAGEGVAFRETRMHERPPRR